MILLEETPQSNPRKPIKEPDDWTEYFETLQERLYRRFIYQMNRAVEEARDQEYVYLNIYVLYRFYNDKNDGSPFLKALMERFYHCARVMKNGYVDAVVEGIERFQEEHLTTLPEQEPVKAGVQNVKYKNWWHRLLRIPESFEIGIDMQIDFHSEDQNEMLKADKREIVKYLIKHHVYARVLQHILQIHDFPNLSEEEKKALAGRRPKIGQQTNAVLLIEEPELVLEEPEIEEKENSATTSQLVIIAKLMNETYKFKRHQDKKPLVDFISFISGRNSKNIAKLLSKYDLGSGVIHKSIKQNLEDYLAVRKIFQGLENQEIVKMIDEKIKEINRLSDK